MEDEQLETYLQRTIATNAPVLAAFIVDDDEEKQLFIVIDKKVFIELRQSSYANSVILLLASYYIFNLQYDAKQMNMFRFLEEYVLKINLKKRSLKYKRQVNKLLSN